MPRRKYAKYMALSGAVTGVAQGLSDAMAARWRQNLLEIQEKYRQQERADERAFRSEEREADREFRTDLLDTQHTNRLAEAEYAEGLRRKPNLDDPKLPETFTGESIRAAREAGDPSLLDPRKDSTTDGRTAGRKDYEFFKDLPPEEREIWEHVNNIKDDGLTEKDRTKYVLDLYSALEKMGIRDRKDRLHSMGVTYDPKDKETDESLTVLQGDELENAVIGHYRELINSIAPPQEPVGLGLYQQSGNPGSSRDNPLTVGPNDPQPPTGTWVKLPDGRIGQVP